MKVLSLFDGMSCGQIALKEGGFVIDKYYASEIDKFAIKQTQLNFPDIIQLGSVTEWRTWDIDWSSINLICAGSPCQGFSFAGKQLAFDDPRSKLFFVFVEILNHCKKFNPEVKFLLENVDMKRDHLRIISEYVGIFPTRINSALVSAQNRDRFYWSNIRTKYIGLFDEIYTDIPQPIDEGILLRDILQPENEVDEKYYCSEKMFNYINKAVFKQDQIKEMVDKSPCLQAGRTDYFKVNRIGELNNSARRYTPIECSRLQTIPSWYKWECSDSQIYRMLGNGWTVKVIEHIFSFL